MGLSYTSVLVALLRHCHWALQRAARQETSYLLFGRNRRGRVLHNNGNAQAVHVHGAPPPGQGKQQGSAVCTLLQQLFAAAPAVTMQVEQVVGAGPGALAPERARPNHWYLLTPTSRAPAPAPAPADAPADAPVDAPAAGALPEPRVGHTASYLPRQKKVVLLGGASPCALYSEVWQLDLHRLTLDLLKPGPASPAAQPPQRYEHCAFLPQDLSDRIWVFAGANMEGNMNDLWELDLAGEEWRALNCSGDAPGPRTLHTTTAEVSGALMVFGGGSQAASPVEDQTVFKLDPVSRSWTTVSTRGDPPAPRQGHVLVGVGGKLLCHGGMAGNKFFSDLFVLENGQWTAVEDDGRPAPSPRAGHGAVALGNFVYIFGGLGPHGSLDDMWKLDCGALTWEEVLFESDTPRPKPRLDFAMSLIWLPQHFTPQCSNGEAVAQNGVQSEDCSSPDSEKDIPFILLHGGMDDLGTIYNDFHVFCLEDLTN
ncbi:Rab9 effector protein with kelch motifs [Frankliniella fusca]|uniref:Rab9 effector protein with kelch motifs n=1 Tax=Frankliniella fusca TaxID=407009 RepID=A0AAE1HF71_9NEOP|nr:Rab9 effector protein with kelch motifs [Frankliniella fusca]